jgi:nicotinate-nucleotide adenylyltransferase
MRIALFGGSFNPPHNGHVSVARQALSLGLADEVWFLPNYGQSPPKDVAPVADRLAMTLLLNEPGTKVSTIEIDNKLDGETIRVLPFLPAGNTYSFIIGSDQLPGFTKWLNWEKLLRSVQFLVFPRKGFPVEPLYKGMKTINDERLTISDFSSSDIRTRVKNGEPIGHLVPAAVLEYITAHKLYLERPLAPEPAGTIQ